MNQITREQAFDLAKYRYKLADKDGKIWGIIGALEGIIYLYGSKMGDDKTITTSKIGSDYFILCRDLSQLTEIIEHEGESFVPIEKLNKANKSLGLCSLSLFKSHDNIHSLLFSSIISGYNVLSMQKCINKLQSWHFNLGFPQETVKLITNF